MFIGLNTLLRTCSAFVCEDRPGQKYGQISPRKCADCGDWGLCLHASAVPFVIGHNDEPPEPNVEFLAHRFWPKNFEHLRMDLLAALWSGLKRDTYLSWCKPVSRFDYVS